MAGSTRKSNPRLLIAIGAVAVTVAAFAAAFYFLGGAELIAGYMSPMIDGLTQMVSGQDTAAEPTDTANGTGSEATTKGQKALVLPTGMTEDDALRLWQEQVDSQKNIRKLVEGELSEFVIDEVAKGPTTAKLTITGIFKDGTSAPGMIKMHKLGGRWYLAWIQGFREGDTKGSADTVNTSGGEPITPLPTAEEVDVKVLQTVLDEQVKSQEIFADYLDGDIDRIEIGKVKEGPRTRTVSAIMFEDKTDYPAQMILVSRDVEGSPMWFFTKFKKTGAGQ